MKDIRKRVAALIDDISHGIYEREETIAVALLSAVSGQSLFLYGPPGTAKSLIARRVACAFRDSCYFEYLMQRFSTPEDVFGPVSISELKNDNYIRKTENYLPKADIAFLDEIWKSSPAILNTLLTIINERTFKNGQRTEKVPLKAIIAASNEFPGEDDGLDALYDRFTVRMKVFPLKNRENFEAMISGDAAADIAESAHAFSMDEWGRMIGEIGKVKVTDNTMETIDRIRDAIKEQNESGMNMYISDRRWQRSVFVMKASAFLNGRSETSRADVFMLSHCLWSSDLDIDVIHKIVDDAVSSGDVAEIGGMKAWMKEFEEVEDSIMDTFFHDRDIYGTVTIGNTECFRSTAEVDLAKGKENFTIYIPTEYLRQNKAFHPLDENGNADDRFQCNFNANETTVISMDTHYKAFLQGNPFGTPYDRGGEYECVSEFTAAADARRGACKDTPEGTREAYIKTLDYLDGRIAAIHGGSMDSLKKQEEGMRSPFIPIGKQEMMTKAMRSNVNAISDIRNDLERLREKVVSYERA